MKQHRINFLAAGLTMVFLLSGCGGQAGQSGSPSSSGQKVLTEETDQVDEMFADVEASRQEGSLQMGFVDSLEKTYTYTGEPLCIHFSMQSSGDVGLILLADGILQPFTVEYPDGTTRREAAMQVFPASEMETKVNLVFQPVTGKQGDSLSVMAATIWEPKYLPENEENPVFGNYHALSATLSRKIVFQADSAGSATLSKEYEVKDIPQAKLDELAAWDSLELLNSSILITSSQSETSPVGQGQPSILWKSSAMPLAMANSNQVTGCFRFPEKLPVREMRLLALKRFPANQEARCSFLFLIPHCIYLQIIRLQTKRHWNV